MDQLSHPTFLPPQEIRDSKRRSMQVQKLHVILSCLSFARTIQNLRLPELEFGTAYQCLPMIYCPWITLHVFRALGSHHLDSWNVQSALSVSTRAKQAKMYDQILHT